LPARADAVIEYPFAAMHESLIGTYGACRATLTMSVVRGKWTLRLGASKSENDPSRTSDCW